MECREVREYLPAYIDGGSTRATEVDRHLPTCSDCRAELEQYRDMASDLSQLSESHIEPPAWLLGTLQETVTERATRVAAMRERREQLSDPKVVATGGAILVAGLAGALLMRGMRRRRRRSLKQKVQEALAQA